MKRGMRAVMRVAISARAGRNGGLLVTLAFLGILSAAWAGQADFAYIECYDDDPSQPDLNGRQITYGDGEFQIDNCAGECTKAGFPYFGIQAQKTCFCDDTYGDYGITNTCTFVCNTNTKCGGQESNDVYYTLKIDATSKAARSDVAYADGLTFTNARRTCVKSDGDLITVTSTAELATLQALLQNTGISKVWQGIWQLNTDYKWVNPTVGGAPTRSNAFWKAGETHANPCVVIDVATGKWESTSCSAQHSYVCHQGPTPEPDPTSSTNTSTSDGADEETTAFDKSKLSLYIVLPVFGLCYGGSCVLYCSHKIYKSFKRKKRQKMLLSRLEDMQDGTVTPTTEYEPHTKPKYEPQKPGFGRPFSGSKRGTVFPVMAPPVQNGYFADQLPPKPEERHVKTPVEDIKIPSPRGEPEGEQAEEEHSDTRGKEDDRPDTTRDVQINMEPERESTPVSIPSPPPAVVSASAIATASVAVDAMRKPRGTQSAKTKTEIRREKLLKKALQEARERRRQEGTPVPGDKPPTPNENQWAQPTGRKPSPKYDDETDSGDSTVNLLDDNDRGRSADMGRDPTTMSIQEILRMKVSMRSGNRRRPKKILSA